MTVPYVDPNSIHNPATGTSPPASWGDNIRDGLELLIDPPRCVISRTAGQTLTSGALFAVDFTGSEFIDTDGFHDPASNSTRMTVPTGFSGWYRATASVSFDTDTALNATTVSFRQLTFRVNGSTTSTECLTVPPPGGHTADLNLTADLSLNAGDYVEVMAGHTSSTDRVVSVAKVSLTWIGRP